MDERAGISLEQVSGLSGQSLGAGSTAATDVKGMRVDRRIRLTRMSQRAGMSLDEKEWRRPAEVERLLHLVRSRMRMPRGDV
jgi:hypothetical protein